MRRRAVRFQVKCLDIKINGNLSRRQDNYRAEEG
ncbi:hypothetical protein BVI434_4300001 [Burkholderia vietnamiensis]|nr:hypothetical protein BVI434_4300001 [Burkholderia vietnamiensis]